MTSINKQVYKAALQRLKRRKIPIEEAKRIIRASFKELKEAWIKLHRMN